MRANVLGHIQLSLCHRQEDVMMNLLKADCRIGTQSVLSPDPETPIHSIDKKDLIKKFSTFLPAETILFEEEDLSPYECDGLSAYRTLPWLAVLPETIEQVQKILQICHARNIPVVPRGAGTGLSGGTLPLKNGVLISLAKFNNILAIDPTAWSAQSCYFRSGCSLWPLLCP
jgi:hypothetical protein